MLYYPLEGVSFRQGPSLAQESHACVWRPLLCTYSWLFMYMLLYAV